MLRGEYVRSRQQVKALGMEEVSVGDPAATDRQISIAVKDFREACGQRSWTDGRRSPSNWHVFSPYSPVPLRLLVAREHSRVHEWKTHALALAKELKELIWLQELHLRSPIPRVFPPGIR